MTYGYEQGLFKQQHKYVCSSCNHPIDGIGGLCPNPYCKKYTEDLKDITSIKTVRFGHVTEDEVKLLMANQGQVYGPRAKYSQRIMSMLEDFAKQRGLA
jgi:hypothetical protein